MTHEELEEGKVLKLDFAKLRKVANCESDVLPAIAQDASTGEVLIRLRERTRATNCARMRNGDLLEHEPQRIVDQRQDQR